MCVIIHLRKCYRPVCFPRNWKLRHIKLLYYRLYCMVVAASWRKRLGAPTGGVPNSRLGPSMWVSWWTKRGLGRFFSGFLPFSPATNFISPFLHPHLIHFVSFHPPLWWCVRRGRPAPLLLMDLCYRGFIASHPSTRPCVGHELRIFIYCMVVKLGLSRWERSIG